MDCKLLVRPDVRVHNMETKIDTLSEQRSNMTPLMKKRHKTPSSHVQERATETFGPTERIFSYCRRPGHGVGRCPDNPNRDPTVGSRATGKRRVGQSQK